ETAIAGLSLEGEEFTGANIVKFALSAPLKQIALNAGLEPGVVAEKVRGLAGSEGLNAATGEYEDLLAAGINDPVKVTRSALRNAASFRTLFLTTGAAVADKPEPAGAPRPGGDEMGGMGFKEVLPEPSRLTEIAPQPRGARRCAAPRGCGVSESGCRMSTGW